MADKKSKYRFSNELPTPMNPEGTSMWKALGKMIKGIEGRRPDHPIKTHPVRRQDMEEIKSDYFIHLGHSGLFIQTEGTRIIIDPVFSRYASPFKAAGPKAFDYTNSYKPDQFPDPDIYLISHDHYDHLDKSTVKSLKNRTGIFVCPLKVGDILQKWGVPEHKIIELNLGEYYSHNDTLRITSGQARHFSGRGLTSRMSTLWSSYIITSGNHNIFFSGDSGYGPHFKDIGDKYGPFGHAFLECGQYNENWPLIHMKPEETVQAAIDLNTNKFTPVHWGKFALSLHPWDEPPKKAEAEAQRLDQKIEIPAFGSINYL